MIARLFEKVHQALALRDRLMMRYPIVIMVSGGTLGFLLGMILDFPVGSALGFGVMAALCSMYILVFLPMAVVLGILVLIGIVLRWAMHGCS